MVEEGNIYLQYLKCNAGVSGTSIYELGDTIEYIEYDDSINEVVVGHTNGSITIVNLYNMLEFTFKTIEVS